MIRHYIPHVKEVHHDKEMDSRHIQTTERTHTPLNPATLRSRRKEKER